MKKIASSAELRSRAWIAMTATWQTVLFVTCVISLVSYVASEVANAVPVLGSFLSLLVSVALTVPTIGLVKGTLDFLRGKALTFDCIRSMFPHWKQTILLTLWTGLCVFGWMAIGMVIMLVGGMVGSMADSSGGMTAIFVLVGMVVMIVLLTRATLNYSMSQCILVDNPDVGASNALRQSREMIRGYRWHYVKVGLPLVLVYLVIGVIAALMSSALGENYWMATLITSVLSIAPNVMSRYFMPVMYEELKRIGR